jgi:hypothetical protein
MPDPSKEETVPGKGKKWICVFPGCNVGPMTDGGYLERVNPKGEPFEGACPDHYEAVVLDQEEGR